MSENNDSDQNLPPRDAQGRFIAESSPAKQYMEFVPSAPVQTMDQVEIENDQSKEITLPEEQLWEIIRDLIKNNRTDLRSKFMIHAMSELPLYLTEDDLDTVSLQLSNPDEKLMIYLGASDANRPFWIRPEDK